MNDMKHLDYIRAVAEEDLRYVDEKDRSYGGSWKRRGGVGAFMMLARKWDRLEVFLSGVKYDIFEAIEQQTKAEIDLHISRVPAGFFGTAVPPEIGKDGTVLAEVRDLRRYLMLVEAEMMARDVVTSASERMVLVSDHVDVKAGLAGSTPVPEKVLMTSAVMAHEIKELDPNFSKIVLDGKIHERGKPPRWLVQDMLGHAVELGDPCTWLLNNGDSADVVVTSLGSNNVAGVRHVGDTHDFPVDGKNLRYDLTRAKNETEAEKQARERRVPRFETEHTVYKRVGAVAKAETTITREFDVPKVSGFDVGNGHVQEGDRAVLVVDGVKQQCTVLTVLQDGDVVVEVDELGHTVTTKWRYVHPQPVPAQRTAVDDVNDLQTKLETMGVVHSQVAPAPWIVTDGYWRRKNIEEDLFKHFWNRKAADVLVLEPHVQSHNIPRVLQNYYYMRGETWTLRISMCPADIRDYFPRLKREKNMKTWEELPEWQRVLYTWNNEASKYELSDVNTAWAGEEET